MELSTSKQNWQPIPGFRDRYYINDLGTIYSVKRASRKNGLMQEAYLVQRLNNRGYYSVKLSLNGKTHTLFVHRLLAMTFLPNPKEYKEVNHIDGVKTNNSLQNLEWTSHSLNLKHAYQLGLISKSKQVYDRCINRTYNNARAAAQCLGLNYNTFRNYLNGNIKNPTCLEYLDTLRLLG